MLHSFFVVHSSCCTFFILYSFHVAPFPYGTLFIFCLLFLSLFYISPLKFLNLILIPGAKLDGHKGIWTGFFHVSLLLMYAFLVLHLFPVVLSSCCTFFILYSFHVAPFTYGTLFVFCYFYSLFMAFFELPFRLMFDFFLVAIFSCFYIPVLHFTRVALFSHFNLFLLHSSHVALLRVALLSCCFFCYTLFTLHFSYVTHLLSCFENEKYNQSFQCTILILHC